MANRYEIFINIDKLANSIYEKSFDSEGFDIIYKDENILFAKKLDDKNNNKCEKLVLDVIVSMAKKIKPEGIVHIDLSNEIASILEKIKDDENVRGYDNRITWPIRQAFTRALISKNKQENNNS